MAKNYYVILGVGANATQDQIKSAYRSKAKEWHPDHSGAGCEPFLDVREAYEVLGDAERRQAYDDQVAREQRRAQQAAWDSRAEPLRSRRCPVEPLVPSRPPGRGAAESPFSSLFSELLGHWRGPDPAYGSGARQPAQEIHLEVSLTHAEALHGGRLRLWIPVQIPCPACRGQGGTTFFGCLHCHGRGTVVDDYPVDIRFPGGLVDGAEAQAQLGRTDLSVVLHFRVYGW